MSSTISLDEFEITYKCPWYLFQAARDGEVNAMKKILDQLGHHRRRKINMHDENELSALHYACRYNHIKIVKLLVEYGASKYIVSCFSTSCAPRIAPF